MTKTRRNGTPREVSGVGHREKSAEDFYRAGIILLRRKREKEALAAFEHACKREPDDSLYRSYYGLCLAITRRRSAEGVQLCAQAAEEEFFRPEVHLNLGKALLATGRREEAERAFREGLSLDEDNREIIRELEKMGVRKRPLLPFLPRRNPLNRWPGLLFHRLKPKS